MRWFEGVANRDKIVCLERIVGWCVPAPIVCGAQVPYHIHNSGRWAVGGEAR